MDRRGARVVARMITIRALSGDAGYQSYGPQYEARIGPATARKLCAGQLPRMGHSLDVKRGLHVANVCGQYFIRTPYYCIEQWPHEYGITVRK